MNGYGGYVGMYMYWVQKSEHPILSVGGSKAKEVPSERWSLMYLKDQIWIT